MTPYGGGIALFQLVDATAINPYTLALTFSEEPNLDSPDTKDPSNYYIERVLGESTVLPVKKIVPDPNPLSLRLITSEQFYTLYRVRVNEVVESIFGSTLNPLVSSKEFTGFPQVGRLRAQAVRPDGVLIVFNQEMIGDENFLSPLSYAVLDPDGVPVEVTEVQPNLMVNPTRVTLQLASPLVAGIAYSLTVSDKVLTTFEMTVVPATSKITWYNPQRTARISLAKFTGEVQAQPPDPNRTASEVFRLEESLAVELVPYRIEPTVIFDAFQEILSFTESLVVTSGTRFTESLQAVTVSESFGLDEFANFTKRVDTRSSVELSLSDRVYLSEALEILPRLESQTEAVDAGLGDLFGNPQGLVFFSPSLIPGGSPNSILQVDRVKTCTEAHDTYRFPQPADPKPLYTHGGGIVATPSPSSTLNNASLFVEFYRLGEAKFNLTNRPQETVPLFGDIIAGLTLREEDPTRTAKLNSPGWLMFKSPMPPVGDFIPLDDHTSRGWPQFDASAATPYPFITVNNLSPLPDPVVEPTQHFVSPMEVLGLVEEVHPDRSVLVGVDETVTRQDDFDLVPGSTVVQVNLVESMTHSEALTSSIGIRLFESITLSEGLSLTS